MRSSQFGGAGALVGDLKFMLGSKPFYVENGQEWLRLGSMVPYTSAYAALVARCPGLGVVALPARSGSLSTPSYNTLVYYVAGQYIAVGGTNNSSPECYCSANLTTWSGMGLAVYMNGYRNAMQHGSRLVIGGTWNSANLPLVFTNGASVAQCGGLPVTSIGYSAMASNGTLCVVAANQAVTPSAAQVATSTDGANFTTRTTSGGVASVIAGLHWAPIANKFLAICWNGSTSILKSSADGYTFADLSMPVGASFANDFVYGYPWVASSPTVTLISLADGRLLRTTDGANYGLVDLGVAGMNNPPTTQCRLLWDGTRFILIQANGVATNGGGTGVPLFAYSTDGGATWADSFAYDDLALPFNGQYALPTISYANGKHLLVGNGSGYLYEITGLIASAPTKVGSMRYVLPTPQSNSLQQYGYVRIR